MATFEERVVINEFDEAVTESKKAECYTSIHLINGFMVFFSAVVLILALLSSQDERVIFFAAGFGVTFVILIISACNDVYAYSVLIIFFAAYFVFNLIVILVDFKHFYEILPVAFTSNMVAPCPKPYCSGWRTDVFVIFYFFLILLELSNFGALYMFFRVFALEGEYARSKRPRGERTIGSTLDKWE